MSRDKEKKSIFEDVMMSIIKFEELKEESLKKSKYTPKNL